MEQRHRVDPVVFRLLKQFCHASTEVRNRLEGLARKAGVANRAEAPRIAASAGLTVRAPASSAKG